VGNGATRLVDDKIISLFCRGQRRICVAIWETGEWPEDWTFSTFIPLPKIGDLKQCANYRNNCSCLTRKQDPSSDQRPSLILFTSFEEVLYS